MLSDVLCACGCGQRTPIAKRTAREYGTQRGEPLTFARGHRIRTEPVPGEPDENGCLLWPGAVGTKGHGLISRAGYRTTAHRWFYIREHGPLPPEIHLHHTCGNPACVNIDHLQPVTAAEHGAIHKAARAEARDA